MPLLETKGAASAQGFGGAGAGASGPVTYIEDVFSTYLYTGNGSTQTITNGIDLSTYGGLVWIKGRTNTFNHFLKSNGIGNNYLSSNNTASATSESFSYSTSTTGFSFSTAQNILNGSGNNYASWTFRKQAKFFDVVTYTGNNNNSQTINHSLGVSPGCIIVKNIDNGSGNWKVYHRGLSGQGYQILLNTTGPEVNVGSGAAYDWAPTATTFNATFGQGTNSSSTTYIAYLFAHNAGGFGLTGTDNVISCGSFSTDGSGNATVSLGYEPQWLMYKCSNAVGDWEMVDVMRGWVVGVNNDNGLRANSSDAESSGSNRGEPSSTGFNCVSFPTNRDFIYIAIRRGPMKVPTDTTTVFKVNYPGSYNDSTLLTVGFPSDEVLYVPFLQNNGSKTPIWYARLMGSYALMSASTAGETGYGSPTFANQTQFAPNYAGSAGVAVLYSFRRAPSFSDVVCYTGNGASNNAKTHNLGVAPELLIIKNRSSSASGDWYTFHTFTSSNFKKQLLDTTDAQTNYTYGNFLDAQPTSTTFTVNSGAGCNESGVTYVAYLFTSCPGVSKVGSYTGTGTTLQIDCGFTGGAKFVLIKRTDSTGNWWVWDTSRGMVAGTDPRFPLNSLDRDSNNNWVYTNASGFEIVTTDSTVNANGGTYIFLAIA